MFRTYGRQFVSLGIILATVVAGCSSGGSNPTGSGGREFVSGDMNNGQSFTHVFAAAKVVPYFCRYHGGAGGIGMSGVITVVAGGAPTRHTFSITAMTLPTLSVSVGDTMVWTNNSGMVHTVESDH